MIKDKIIKMLCLFTTLMLISCDDVFDVHPYDVNIKGETHINATNISKIENLCKDKDTLKIAFISDTHGWYSDFKDEVADINRRRDIDFVIHCGDITDTG
ncbi:MAG: metallophosphoesterase, partial [Prevotella sp.]|nr:metallophosphoesterase [Prevotella sp.]